MTGFLETSHTAEAEVGGYFLALELSAEYIRQNERGRYAIQALQGSDMFRGRYSWRKASWLSSDPRFETRIVTRATSPLDTEKMQLILSTISAGESHGKSITLF